jgi:serine/threonine protein kinase
MDLNEKIIDNINGVTEVDGILRRQTSIYETNFEEIERLGQGSFGLVFKVKDRKSGDLFALKIIPVKKEEFEKVTRELKYMIELRSEYVVNYFHSWSEYNYNLSQVSEDETDGSLLSSVNNLLYDRNSKTLMNIQMELCLFTLKEAMIKLDRELRQSPKEILTDPIAYLIACEILTEILECVKFLHSQSIIHRDLKPSNILISLGSDGRFCKVSDFGLSTTHQFDKESHTQATGTLSYMAPEVLQSKRYDTKADIYSLGIIIQKLFHIDVNK